MDNWNWNKIAILIAFLTGVLISEVACMIFESRPYFAAVVVGCVILIMVFVKEK